MFLTHLLAWPWGSMNRGHLREYLTMTPFSTDRLSLGSPAICQLRTLTGSDNVAIRVGSLVRGTLFSSSFLTHSSCMSDRYFPWRKNIVISLKHMYTLVVSSVKMGICHIKYQWKNVFINYLHLWTAFKYVYTKHIGIVDNTLMHVI